MRLQIPVIEESSLSKRKLVRKQKITCKKLRFRDPKQAKDFRFNTKLKIARSGRVPDETRIYFCHLCKGYHTTSKGVLIRRDPMEVVGHVSLDCVGVAP